MTPSKRPILVAGMHRSGTSLVASYLVKSGIDFGKRLIAADARNQRGYFEDTDLVEFHGRVFRHCTSPDDDGHRDWGWTEREAFDTERLVAFRDEARAIVERRTHNRAPWGWKDPRTTLLLDFWDDLLDEARYVFVYRYPWEVADSLQRLGADVFLDHPDYAYRIWCHYNRRLLEFFRAHRDRTVLVSVDALSRDPERLAAVLGNRLGIALKESALQGGFERQLLVEIAGDDPLIALAEMAFPEAVHLLEELDSESDISSRGLWSRRATPRSASDPSAGAPSCGVVIPCQNLGALLIEAVASVERDTTPTEIVIVDDGSTEPRTVSLFEKLRRAGYSVISQRASGLAAARNRGISATRAPYVLPLDADNRLRTGFLASAVALLDSRAEIGVVYGDRMEFGKRSGLVVVDDFDPDALLESNYIDACTVFRRTVWEAVGGYDACLPVWEDWDFWLSAVQRGVRFERLPGVSFDYRVRPRSLCADFSEAEEAHRRRVVQYILAKHEALYRARRTWLSARAQDGHLREAFQRLDDPRAAVAPDPSSLRLGPSWPEAPTDPPLRIAWLETRLAAVERALHRRSAEIRRLQAHACFSDLRRLQRLDAGLAPDENAGNLDDLDDTPVVRRADVASTLTELWKSTERS